MQAKCKQRETQDSRLAFPQRPATRRGPCSVGRELFPTSVHDHEPAPLGNLFFRLTGTQQPVVKVTRAALRALGPTEQRLAAPEIRCRALHAAGRKRRITLWATDFIVPIRSEGGADLAAHRDRAFSSQRPPFSFRRRPPRPSALSFVGGDRPGSPSSSLRAERPQKPAAPSTGLPPRAAKAGCFSPEISPGGRKRAA